LLVAYFNYLE